MPRLSCWTCGRLIYTVAPIASLFPEERRCPRCGAYLNTDRREVERRVHDRRVNPIDDPGPPRPAVKTTRKTGATVVAVISPERRVDDRRSVRRRA